MSWTEALLIPLGFAAGAYGTMVGAGGGFVLVPALLLIYSDESQAEVTAISLAVVLANSLSGTVAYARRRLIDYRTGLTFAAAAVPLSFAGAYAVRFLSRGTFDFVFGLALMALAALTVYGVAVHRPVVREPLLPGRGVVVRTLRPEAGLVYRYAYRLWHGLAFSAAIGFASSLFGVGGGIMQVPVLVTILRVPVEISVATSQFMLVFMAASGTAVHLAAGDLGAHEAARAGLLALGAIPGAQAGAWLAMRVKQRFIVPALALGLVIVGMRLVVSAWL